MRRPGGGLVLLIVLAWAVYGPGQTPAPAPGSTAADDPVLRQAETLVGKSLFLRGFPSNDELRYDAMGRLSNDSAPVDWTLAGVNILKVSRKDAAELELDGVRVAIRYNPEAHEFQRHPQNEQKIQTVMEAPSSAGAAEVAFAAMFSYGIDPALQRSMPEYWRHYFDPSLAWPKDSVSGQTVYRLYGGPDQPKDVTPPRPLSPEAPRFTPLAERDRVQGAVMLGVVVDAQGAPVRVWVARPLGYGLDERAVQAVSRWKFAPAMRNGSPVAAGIYVEQSFVISPPR